MNLELLASLGFALPAMSGCGRIGFATDVDASTDSNNATPATSCLDSTAGSRMFIDNFADFTQWTPRAGSWTTALGVAVQTDSSASLSYAVVSGRTFTNSRAVASIRQLGGTAPDRAVEIALRVAPQPSHAAYHCNWEPVTGGLLLQQTAASGMGMASFDEHYVDVSIIPGYSIDMPVTMEFEVEGTRLSCCVREIPGAALTVVDLGLSQGGVGIRTYLASGSFDDFTVFGF